MSIEWVSLARTDAPKQDVRVSISNNGVDIIVAFKFGFWASKLARSTKIAVGFDTNGGVPIAMYFAPSSSGYAVRNARGNSTPSVRISVGKVSSLYPRLKVSELQGEYVAKYDETNKCYFISLGAKSY